MRLAERAASQWVREETRTQACIVAVAGEGARLARAGPGGQRTQKHPIKTVVRM